MQFIDIQRLFNGFFIIHKQILITNKQTCRLVAG